MIYALAFDKLGYVLDNKRQDWSAANDVGICISIWQKECRTGTDRLPYFDMRELHPAGGEFETKPGFGKRTDHIARCIAEHGGRIDVVLVSGEPGGPFGDAQAWDPAARGGHWRVTRFDEATGFFRAEVERVKPLPAPAAKAGKRTRGKPG